MTPVIHIAGADVQVGARVRQRCSWCGALLINVHLPDIAVPVGQEPAPGTWPVGELVAVDGAAAYVVQHEDGSPIPDGACGRLDPEVTA